MISALGLSQNKGDGLLGEDEYGNGLFIFEQDLKEMQDLIRSSGIQFVLLNVCHSENIGKVFKESGVSHVICIQRDSQLLDKAAITFSKNFYSALYGQQLSISASFKSAVNSVKKDSSEKEAEKYLLLRDQDEKEEITFEKVEAKEVEEDKEELLLVVPSDPVKTDITYLRRREVLGEIIQLIKNQQYLLIHGPAGIGKTALIKELCHFVAPRAYFKAVCYFDLKHCSSFLDIIQKVKKNMQKTNESLEEIIHELAVNQENLLIFDNLDSVLQGALEKLLDYFFMLYDQFERNFKVVLLMREEMTESQYGMKFGMYLFPKLRESEQKEYIEKKLKSFNKKITLEEIQKLDEKTQELGQKDQLGGLIVPKSGAQDLLNYLLRHPIFSMLGGIILSMKQVLSQLQNSQLFEIYELMMSSDMISEKPDRSKILYQSSELVMNQIGKHRNSKHLLGLIYLLGTFKVSFRLQDLVNMFPNQDIREHLSQLQAFGLVESYQDKKLGLLYNTNNFTQTFLFIKMSKALNEKIKTQVTEYVLQEIKKQTQEYIYSLQFVFSLPDNQAITQLKQCIDIYSSICQKLQDMSEAVLASDQIRRRNLNMTEWLRFDPDLQKEKKRVKKEEAQDLFISHDFHGKELPKLLDSEKEAKPNSVKHPRPQSNYLISTENKLQDQKGSKQHKFIMENLDQNELLLLERLKLHFLRTSRSYDKIRSLKLKEEKELKELKQTLISKATSMLFLLNLNMMQLWHEVYKEKGKINKEIMLNAKALLKQFQDEGSYEGEALMFLVLFKLYCLREEQQQQVDVDDKASQSSKLNQKIDSQRIYIQAKKKIFKKLRERQQNFSVGNSKYFKTLLVWISKQSNGLLTILELENNFREFGLNFKKHEADFQYYELRTRKLKFDRIIEELLIQVESLFSYVSQEEKFKKFCKLLPQIQKESEETKGQKISQMDNLKEDLNQSIVKEADDLINIRIQERPQRKEPMKKKVFRDFNNLKKELKIGVNGDILLDEEEKENLMKKADALGANHEDYTGNDFILALILFEQQEEEKYSTAGGPTAGEGTRRPPSSQAYQGPTYNPDLLDVERIDEDEEEEKRQNLEDSQLDSLIQPANQKREFLRFLYTDPLIQEITENQGFSEGYSSLQEEMSTSNYKNYQDFAQTYSSAVEPFKGRVQLMSQVCSEQNLIQAFSSACLIIHLSIFTFEENLQEMMLLEQDVLNGSCRKIRIIEFIEKLVKFANFIGPKWIYIESKGHLLAKQMMQMNMKNFSIIYYEKPIDGTDELNCLKMIQEKIFMDIQQKKQLKFDTLTYIHHINQDFRFYSGTMCKTLIVQPSQNQPNSLKNLGSNLFAHQVDREIVFNLTENFMEKKLTALIGKNEDYADKIFQLFSLFLQRNLGYKNEEIAIVDCSWCSSQQDCQEAIQIHFDLPAQIPNKAGIKLLMLKNIGKEMQSDQIKDSYKFYQDYLQDFQQKWMHVLHFNLDLGGKQPQAVFGRNPKSSLVQIDKFYNFSHVLDAIFVELNRKGKKQLLSEEQVQSFHRFSSGLEEIEHIEQRLWSETNRKYPKFNLNFLFFYFQQNFMSQFASKITLINFQDEVQKIINLGGFSDYIKMYDSSSARTDYVIKNSNLDQQQQQQKKLLCDYCGQEIKHVYYELHCQHKFHKTCGDRVLNTNSQGTSFCPKCNKPSDLTQAKMYQEGGLVKDFPLKQQLQFQDYKAQVQQKQAPNMGQSQRVQNFSSVHQYPSMKSKQGSSQPPSLNSVLKDLSEATKKIGVQQYSQIVDTVKIGSSQMQEETDFKQTMLGLLQNDEMKVQALHNAFKCRQPVNRVYYVDITAMEQRQRQVVGNSPAKLRKGL